MRARLLALAACLALAPASGACKSSSGSTGAVDCAGGGSGFTPRPSGGHGGGGGEGGSGCPIEASPCADCLQIFCGDETAACSADPGCSAANDRLLACGCPAQLVHDLAGLQRHEQEFTATGSIEAAAAACLEAHCADLCGW